jgi:hypothetical protein
MIALISHNQQNGTIMLGVMSCVMPISFTVHKDRAVIMNTALPEAKYCRFTDLNNGIWIFAFTEPSNRAVDEWYEWQSYLKETAIPSENRRVRMLLDLRMSGPLPLLYSLQQGRDWRKKYSDLNSFRVQIAALLKHFPRYQQSYAKLIKDGVNLFTKNQVEIEVFFGEQRQATDWLLQP